MSLITNHSLCGHQIKAALYDTLVKLHAGY